MLLTSTAILILFQKSIQSAIKVSMKTEPLTLLTKRSRLFIPNHPRVRAQKPHPRIFLLTFILLLFQSGNILMRNPSGLTLTLTTFRLIKINRAKPPILLLIKFATTKPRRRPKRFRTSSVPTPSFKFLRAKTYSSSRRRRLKKSVVRRK